MNLFYNALEVYTVSWTHPFYLRLLNVISSLQEGVFLKEKNYKNAKKYTVLSIVCQIVQG